MAMMKSGLVLPNSCSRKGFEIGIAENGREGLKIFLDKAFDLVLTDFRMPYMDGLILESEIRKKQPKTIIVMMSGDQKLSAQTRGAADHILAKPFGVKEIYNLVVVRSKPQIQSKGGCPELMTPLCL
jgi:DNA-binding response OmpR family regulator